MNLLFIAAFAPQPGGNVGGGSSGGGSNGGSSAEIGESGAPIARLESLDEMGSQVSESFENSNIFKIWEKIKSTCTRHNSQNYSELKGLVKTNPMTPHYTHSMSV